MLMDEMKTEENYKILCDRVFPYLAYYQPYTDAITNQYDESELFDIKYSDRSPNGSFEADGTVFAQCGRTIMGPAFSYDLYYRLNQEVLFERGEITSLKHFAYYGDFWIPEVGHYEYVSTDDTLAILHYRAHRFIPDPTVYARTEDLDVSFPIYRKTNRDSTQIEFGIVLQSAGTSPDYKPLKRILINTNHSEQTVVCWYNYDYNYLWEYDVSMGRYFQYNTAVFGFENLIQNATTIFPESTENLLTNADKIVYKLDRKTGEVIEKTSYVRVDDEWVKKSVEVKTDRGFIQQNYVLGRSKTRDNIVVHWDENQNPVFTRTEPGKSDVVLFQVKNDTIVLDQSITEKATFVIHYW